MVAIIASTLVSANDADITVILEKNTPVDGTYSSVPLKYIITKEMISEGAYSDLSDVLRSIPSLTFANDSLGNGTTGVMDLRGFGETAHSSTLVLLNGAVLNNPTNEAPNLSLIPLAMIEKIEILVGGASAAIGNEAVGGVISISTIPGSVANFNQARIYGGQFGTAGATVSGAVELDRHSGISYSAEAIDQTGYRDFSEFQRKTSNLSWSHSLNDVAVTLNILNTNEDRNGSGAISQSVLNSDRTAVGTRSVADISQNLFSGTITRRQSPNTQFRLDLSSRKSDQFVFYDYTPGTPFVAEEQVDQETTVNTASFLRQFNLEKYKYDFGLTVRESDYENTREYYGYSPTIKNQNRQEWSVFAEYSQAVSSDSRATVSYRHLDSKDDLGSGSETNQSLNAISVSLTRKIEQTDYFARLDKGFRLPTFDENNSTYTDQYLLPQTHVSVEAGFNNPLMGLSWFFMQTENEIRPTIKYYSSGLYGPYYSATNANFKKTSRLGVQASRTINISPKTRMDTAYSYTEAKSVDGLDENKHIPGVPTNIVSLSFKHQHNFEFTSALDWRYQSGSYALNDHQNLYGRHGEYAIIDYALTYKKSGFSAGIRLNNLLDNRYNLYHIVSATPSTAASDGPSATPAEPINLQVHMEYVF